jgi:DNA-binding transcriptional ArsR family regulator
VAPTPTPSRVLGALADPKRLRILAAIILTAGDIRQVAEAAGMPTKQVDVAIGTLESAGVIRPTDDRHAWEVVPATFGAAARAVARMRPEVEPEELGATAEQAPVLRSFLAGGRLTGLPVQASKRAVVLDFVGQRFEPGRRYSEAEVNQILDQLWDDHATLRRALVDEGMLDREDGQYWRSGGTFDVDGGSA